METNNIIICGLGALGLTYADKLVNKCNLKILADTTRIQKYKAQKPIFNNKPLELDYISPNEIFQADLIIITTKSTNLDSAIKYIKNYVSKKTIIISLINGISSENKLKTVYPEAQIIRSYFIGHSAMRKNINGTDLFSQDGVGKIVLEHNKELEQFFKKTNIEYEISDDIIYSQWVKLGVNIVLNQLSAIHKKTVGELRLMEDYKSISESLLKEIENVAKEYGINNLDKYYSDVINSINLISDDGKTSMYQDIISKKKTEVDIFSGEIIKLGKKFNIATPINQEIYDKIKAIEEDFSWT